MKIHEYQAKKILNEAGVAVPRGIVASTADEAKSAALDLGGDLFAVKAQIHAGGRGKGGGIRLAQSPTAVGQQAAELLGSLLITPQTGPEGKIVNRVLIEEGLPIKRELYLGMTLDRKVGRIALMASSEGGVEIEKVAEKSPEKIFTEHIDPALGLLPFQARKLAFKLGLEKKAVGQAVQFISRLYQVFMVKDCLMAEINPLVLTRDDRILALDAKISFDDNAAFRHKDRAELRDKTEEDPQESRASDLGISYIKLDGSIGCMVNGAGLAMATMDLIKLCGAAPANFLDVGGGASVEQVKNAFKLLVSDSNVKAVFINIFGGIMRCDILAQGVVEAVREVGIAVPLILRLEGTNVELGRQIFADSDLVIINAQGMRDGAEKAVQTVGGLN